LTALRLPDRVRLATAGRVESLDFDRYVTAALTAETGPGWDAAALEAQAVACRSYTLFAVLHPRASDHDVVAGSADQLVDLRPDPPEPVAAAVAATVGRVLVAPGWRFGRPKPVKGMFHASCGGGTDGARSVWPGSRLRGLAGVTCPSCSRRGSRVWETMLPLAEFLGVLGLPAVRSRELDLSHRPTSSRRVASLHVGVGKQRVSVTGEELRALLGYEQLRSARFRYRFEEVPPDRAPTHEIIRFEGTGHGHGVGMCQRGAEAMAADGASAADILSHYYPEADVVRGQ
jgi:stage II sporulation protein D